MEDWIFKVWIWNYEETLIDTEHPCEVMQFTWVFDQNSKEIYEGDLIRVLDRDWVDKEESTITYMVCYFEAQYLLVNYEWVNERKKEAPNIYNKNWKETKLVEEYWRDRFEVIWNIYENPELLQPQPVAGNNE